MILLGHAGAPGGPQPDRGAVRVAQFLAGQLGVAQIATERSSAF